MSRRKKSTRWRGCWFTKCTTGISDRELFCRAHYCLLSRETRDLLSTTWKLGFYLLHKHAAGEQSLMDKAVAEIQKRIDNGARPGEWRGPLRPAPRFLGNGRGDE